MFKTVLDLTGEGNAVEIREPIRKPAAKPVSSGKVFIIDISDEDHVVPAIPEKIVVAPHEAVVLPGAARLVHLPPMAIKIEKIDPVAAVSVSKPNKQPPQSELIVEGQGSSSAHVEIPVKLVKRPAEEAVETDCPMQKAAKMFAEFVNKAHEVAARGGVEAVTEKQEAGAKDQEKSGSD